jgi:ABC-type phosphate transport system ATPase subunit
MPTVQDQMNNLYNDLINLCEIRGELDPESNAKIEEKINQLSAELQVLQYEQDQAVIDFSCDL